jgi:hypothetical protein
MHRLDRQRPGLTDGYLLNAVKEYIIYCVHIVHNIPGHEVRHKLQPDQIPSDHILSQKFAYTIQKI